MLQLESGSVLPQSFTLRSMQQRLDRVGDLWNALGTHAESLSKPIQRLQSLISEEAWRAGEAALRRKPGRKRAPKA